MNRSNLIFVVEDSNNNKFGEYGIDEPGYSNMFLFSLKSNGRKEK